MWNLISMENALFDAAGGVFIAKTPPIILSDNNNSGQQQSQVVQVFAHSRIANSLVEFLNKVVNGSILVDGHLVMGGQDHYYLVHDQLPDSASLAALNKYQYVTNYTMATGQSDVDKKPVWRNHLYFTNKIIFSTNLYFFSGD